MGEGRAGGEGKGRGRKGRGEGSWREGRVREGYPPNENPGYGPEFDHYCQGCSGHYCFQGSHREFHDPVSRSLSELTFAAISPSQVISA